MSVGRSLPAVALAVALLTAAARESAGSPLPSDFRNLWSNRSLAVLSGGSAVTALAFLLEGPGGPGMLWGSDRLARFEGGPLETAFSPVLLSTCSMGACAAGYLSGSGSVSDFFSPIARGMLMTNGMTGALKLMVQRDRPHGSGRFGFPSAHSASMSFLACYLWESQGWEVGVPVSLATVMVGLSRIDCGAHRPSDVAAGAAIGLLVGYAVARTEDVMDDEQGEAGRGLMLYWDSVNGPGLTGRI